VRVWIPFPHNEGQALIARLLVPETEAA
jgi:hypothetical protein